MKNKFLFILLPILLILGFYGYQKWFSDAGEAWRFVPNSALVVIQSNSLHESSALPDSTLAIQKDIPFLAETQNLLSKLSLKAKSKTDYLDFIKNKTVYYSVHADLSLGVRYISYIPYHDLKDKSFIDNLFEYDASKKIRLFNHDFDGSKIWEVYQDNRFLFAFILEDNYLILGESSVLIEDVSRKTKEVVDGRLPINLINFQSQKQDGNYTKVFFNTQNIQKTTAQLFDGNSEVLLSLLHIIIGNEANNIQTFDSGKANLLSPISVKTKNEILENLKPNVPSYIACSKYIPNSSLYFIGVSCQNEKEDFEGLNQVFKKHQQKQLESLKPIPQSLSDLILNVREMGVCGLPQSEKGEFVDLLILSTKISAKELSKIVYDLQLDNFDNAESVQDFLGKKIIKLKSPLLSHLAGDLAHFSEENYICNIEDKLLVCNSLDGLKQSLTEINENNVWTNNAARIEILEKCKPAQFTLILCPDKLMDEQNNKLSSSWKKVGYFILDKISTQKSIVFQYISDGSTAKEALVFRKPKSGSSGKYIGKLILQKSINFEGKLLQKPLLLSSIESNYPELIFQTSDNNLHVIDSNGEINGMYQLKSPLIDGLKLKTILGKNSPQLFGKLANGFVLCERNLEGITVEESPMLSVGLLKSNNFFQTNSREFHLQSVQNKILKFDTKTLKLLKTSDLEHGSHVLNTHINPKISPIDNVFEISENGKLFVTNLIEEKTTQFDFEKLFQTGIFIDGNSKENLTLTMLSKDGELIKTDKNATVLSRLSLTRPSKETSFNLIFDQNDKDWLIQRKIGTNITILDKAGKEMLQFQNLNPEKSNIQFIKLSGNLSFFIIKLDNSYKIFDFQGNPLVQNSFSSDFEPSFSYNETYHKLFIYTVSQNKLQIYSVKIEN